MTLSKGVEEKEKEEEKYNITSNCFSTMRFSSALISFLSSLPATSVAMAIEEPHDSVLHDVTASILEESLEVKYKNKKSHLEPLKIQNSNDGRLVLADDKGDVMQKKEYHWRNAIFLLLLLLPLLLLLLLLLTMIL